jgi:FtsH-binding integral membrane protein
MENSFEKSQTNFISRTLLTMGLGLLVTFIVAVLTPVVMPNINMSLVLIAVIGEFALVLYLTRRINKMAANTARMWFYVYAALNGYTLSLIFLAYGLDTVTTAFLITSVMFLCSAMIGITTKKDLSAFAQFFMMLVIGIILMSIAGIFININGLNFIIAVIGIIAFCGLTAYDMQKIKKFHNQCYNVGSEDVSRYVIISALSLYLDFINLFLFVLRLFRDR